MSLSASCRPIRALSFPAALLTLAGLISGGLAGAAPSRRANLVLTWEPLGFAGSQFTTLASIPGNPCVVAWTALNNGGVVTMPYLETAVQREYRKTGAVCPLRRPAAFAGTRG